MKKQEQANPKPERKPRQKRSYEDRLAACDAAIVRAHAIEVSAEKRKQNILASMAMAEARAKVKAEYADRLRRIQMGEI